MIDFQIVRIAAIAQPKKSQQSFLVNKRSHQILAVFIWLVVRNIFYFSNVSHIWGIIIPSD